MRAKRRILFLCKGNSCRSQMAEAWVRRLKGEMWEAFSAGVEPRGLDPRAVEVMAEVGVDISSQRSKNIRELQGMDFDYVVTLCSDARDSCPVWLGKARVVHKEFDDPPALAAASPEQPLDHYRRVREEIRRFIENLEEDLPP